MRKSPPYPHLYPQALQYAVRAGDRQAESLALANLGLMGRSQGDLSTAKVIPGIRRQFVDIEHTCAGWWTGGSGL